MTTNNLMTLAEMAREVNLPRQAAQRWHKAQAADKLKRETTPVSPLRAVAKAMGVPVPEADDERSPRYPRSVFVTYCQAVGYMDRAGELVPEVQERIEKKQRGRWLPAKPTLDPQSGAREGRPWSPSLRRRRFYINHVAELTGLSMITLKIYASPKGNAKRSFPKPDGIDEMDRPFWFEETVASYKPQAARQARMEPAQGASEGGEAEVPANEG